MHVLASNGEVRGIACTEHTGSPNIYKIIEYHVWSVPSQCIPTREKASNRIAPQPLEILFAVTRHA